MTVAYAHEPTTWEYLLDTWRELDVPEGYRPELTTEGIFMTPAPGGAHNLIADVVNRALVRCTPDRLGIFHTQAVGIPAAGAIYIPDLCVAPRVAVPGGPDPISGEHVLLAVEITSRSNAEHDRAKKRRAYALGRIPQFLLIDAHDVNGPAVSLFAEPADGEYRRTLRVPFGEPIALGEPFGVDLDTAAF